MNSSEGPLIAAAFEHQVRSGASAAQIAASMAATWRHVEQSLTPIIGPLGVAALYRRSLLMTGRSHPWLAGLHESAAHPADLSAVIAALEQQESTDAALAAAEFLQTFYRQVNALISASLTHRLLNFMWESS